MTATVLLYLLIFTSIYDFKKVMPKIEISMVEVDSDEVMENIRKATSILSGSSNNETEIVTEIPTTTANKKEEEEEEVETTTTVQPKKNKKKKKTVEVIEDDYEEESEEVTRRPRRKHSRRTRPASYEIYDEMTTPSPMATTSSTTTVTTTTSTSTTAEAATTVMPTTSKPWSINDFSSHLVELQESKFSKDLDDDFVNMVAQAKQFVRRYLSPEQWRRLKTLLKTIKEVGGSPYDVHRTATLFLSRTLSRNEMEQINRQRGELFRQFKRNYFNQNYNNLHV